jgi:hypothetical protein
VFKGIIAVYSENHTEPTNIKCKRYLMLKQLVHIATIRLQKLSKLQSTRRYYLFVTVNASNMSADPYVGS